MENNETIREKREYNVTIMQRERILCELDKTMRT